MDVKFDITYGIYHLIDSGITDTRIFRFGGIGEDYEE